MPSFNRSTFSDAPPLPCPTYIPLQFYLSGEGYVEDGDVFAGIGFSPLVQGYVISPVSGADLSPLEAPDVSDYKITINDENVGGDEQGLIMQKIIGLPINLHTAIVIDTSSSNSKASGVDIEALILEVKNFVAEAQSSPDMTIANQQFTLWAYASAGSGVQALVPNFTTSAVIMDNALDSLLVGDVWEERGADSATYEAIVKAVGIYVTPISFFSTKVLESSSTELSTELSTESSTGEEAT